MTRNTLLSLLCAVWASAGAAQTQSVYLQANDGTRIQIATLTTRPDGGYSVEMAQAPFTDHFLSMRPFRCLEGPQKHWCHVPYPYALARSGPQGDPTDLEYDFLFLWKGAADYGINMWNGVYYQLEPNGAGWTGRMSELDMDLLSAPPPEGIVHPIRPQDLTEAEPEGHWLPLLIIE